MYNILTLNKIAAIGTSRLGDNYKYGDDVQNPDAVLVRSAAMHDMEFADNLLAIARAGAGTNNTTDNDNSLMDGAGDLVDDTGNAVGDAIDDIGNTVGDVIDDAGNAVGGAVDNITDGVSDITGDIVGNGDGTGTNTATGTGKGPATGAAGNTTGNAGR